MNRSPGGQITPMWRVLVGLFALAVFATPVRCQEILLSINLSNEPVVAGDSARLWLNALNPADHDISWTFPQKITAHLEATSESVEVCVELALPAEADLVRIAPRTFARREYLLTPPASVTGRVVVAWPGLDVSRFVIEVRPRPIVAVVETNTTPWLDRFLKDAEPLEAGKPFDPGRFFKQHISPHEPMYFIVGAESPNAKFQISFKYQLLRENSEIATNFPALRGFHAAYTQISLWDLSAPSAPFFDTSYKPAFLYSVDHLIGGSDNDWFQLDLMGGAQHESNGKNGVDSRSLNILFLRPTLVFGRDDWLQLTLEPRVWGYVGDLDDNPDLTDYRGYFDLRAVLGWRRGLQLAALGRLGKDGNHHSVQLDLTYPTMRFFDSFSVYLHAQYFTGYGESLLRYNQRSDVFRLGFALYR